jgi:hypothetical protein
MTLTIRQYRTLRLNDWSTDAQPHVTIKDNPNEATVAANESSFINVHENGISLSPGQGGKINIQAMPGAIHYGGMLRDNIFPLSLIPSTVVTPNPRTMFSPPFLEQLPMWIELGIASTSFLAG